MFQKADNPAEAGLFSKGQKKILIVAKQNNIGMTMASRIANKLREAGHDVNFDRSTAIKFRKRGVSTRKFSGDFIVTVGGDGTFLYAAARTSLPIFPLKVEGHGFLTTATVKEFLDNVDRISKNDFLVSKRARIRCYRVKDGRKLEYAGLFRKKYPSSINEIVFARKRPSKILNIDFTIDDVTFNVLGDGLLFSTPSGSTAYSASAGGSIIDPEIRVMKLVPLYPFFSKLKPMVVPENKPVRIKIKKGECALIIDGHEGDYVKVDSEFMVEMGDDLSILSFEKKNFYQKFKDEFIE